MERQTDLKEMDRKIRSMKGTAEELKEMGDRFPAVYRNVSRILAGIKMLEINVSDLVEAETEH